MGPGNNREVTARERGCVQRVTPRATLRSTAKALMGPFLFARNVRRDAPAKQKTPLLTESLHNERPEFEPEYH